MVVLNLPLLSDVYIGDLTASGKFSLQDIPGTPSVHSIYKKLCHFVCFFSWKYRLHEFTSRKDNETTDAGFSQKSELLEQIGTATAVVGAWWYISYACW